MKDAVKIYQSKIDLQSIVDFHEEISKKSDMAQKTRDHMLKDKRRVLESIEEVFKSIHEEVEERRNYVLIEVKK